MKKELKVGMWCWLTNTFPEANNRNIVQIAEIDSSKKYFKYRVISKKPLISYLTPSGVKHIFWCWPDQLIPISDPDMDVSDIDVVDMPKELANA